MSDPGVSQSVSNVKTTGSFVFCTQNQFLVVETMKKYMFLFDVCREPWSYKLFYGTYLQNTFTIQDWGSIIVYAKIVYDIGDES